MIILGECESFLILFLVRIQKDTFVKAIVIYHVPKSDVISSSRESHMAGQLQGSIVILGDLCNFYC